MFAVYNTIRLILGDQNEEMTKVLSAMERWNGRSNRDKSQNRILQRSIAILHFIS